MPCYQVLKFFKEITGQVSLLLQHHRINGHRAKVNLPVEEDSCPWVFLHTGSLVTLSAVHSFMTKDAEKVLVKKGNSFPLPFVSQVLLVALAPGHASHHAQLRTLTQQHRPRHCCLWAPLWISWPTRKRFVCIAGVWYLQHAQSTGWPRELTFTPHTFLNAKSSYQPSVPPQDGRDTSQHPALPPT